MLGKVFTASIPLLVAATAVSALPSTYDQQLPFPSDPAPLGEYKDLTKYTIGQILNWTLYHHPPHKPGDGSRGDGDDGGEDSDLGRTLVQLFPPGRPNHPTISKLAYFVNRSESVKEYLFKEDISVTLFAPDDEALTPPKRQNPAARHGSIWESDAHSETPESVLRGHPFFHIAKDKSDKDKDKDKDKDDDKRKKIDFLITAILKYHISPEKFSLEQLLDKQTIPTILKQTKDVDEPFRIRAEAGFKVLPPPPKHYLVLNFYAKRRPGPAILAKNGIIHLLGAPLLPPLTPFDILLDFPVSFSGLTSAIQQTEVDKAIAPWYHKHRKDNDGDNDEEVDAVLESLTRMYPEDPAGVAMGVLQDLVEEAKKTFGLPASDDFAAFPFTVFAPTNLAILKIPFKIRLFLFSPFGINILRKLLAYHIVPQFILHTDHVVNATRDASYAGGATASLPAIKTILDSALLYGNGEGSDEPIFGGFHSSGPHAPPFPHQVQCELEKYVLPTLLGKEKNETLGVAVVTFREGIGGKGPLKKKVLVGDPAKDSKDFVSVIVSDVVAWGGAIHVINDFVIPPFAHHKHDDDKAAVKDKQLNYFEALYNLD